jgi:hypothetical protein
MKKRFSRRIRIDTEKTEDTEERDTEKTENTEEERKEI